VLSAGEAGDATLPTPEMGWDCKRDSEKAMPPHRAPAAKAAVIRIRRRSFLTIQILSS
jgi:hypothetical protein